MTTKIPGLRQQQFREATIPARARAVKSSKAWLNVQQMLKRSGRICEAGPSSDAEKKDISTFNFEHVSHLYQLYTAVERIKAAYGNAFEMEICELERSHSLWPYNLVISPKVLRRKADAFKQRDRQATVSEPARPVPYGFKGSLYKVLCDFFGDRQKLDIALAELCPDPTALLPQKKIHPGIDSIFRDCPSPVLTLLWLECRRLRFRQEAEWLSGQVNKRRDIHSGEQLGAALFFTFLYNNDDGDLFSSFFRDVRKPIDNFLVRFEYMGLHNQMTEEARQNNITRYIYTVNSRFLFSAYKRKLAQK